MRNKPPNRKADDDSEAVVWMILASSLKSCNSFTQLYMALPGFSHIVGWLATAKLLAVKANKQAMQSQANQLHQPANQAVTATGAAIAIAENPLLAASALAQATAKTPAFRPCFGAYA